MLTALRTARERRGEIVSVVPTVFHNCQRGSPRWRQFQHSHWFGAEERSISGYNQPSPASRKQEMELWCSKGWWAIFAWCYARVRIWSCTFLVHWCVSFYTSSWSSNRLGLFCHSWSIQKLCSPCRGFSSRFSRSTFSATSLSFLCIQMIYGSVQVCTAEWEWEDAFSDFWWIRGSGSWGSSAKTEECENDKC